MSSAWPGPLAWLIGLSGLAGVVVIHIVATQYSLRNPRLVQLCTQALHEAVAANCFSNMGARRSGTAPASRLAVLLVNGRPTRGRRHMRRMAREGFAGFVLDVDGGWSSSPLHLPRSRTSEAWPKQTQITKHCCIQGWWSGVARMGWRLVEPTSCDTATRVRLLLWYSTRLDDKSISSEPDPAESGLVLRDDRHCAGIASADDPRLRDERWPVAHVVRVHRSGYGWRHNWGSRWSSDVRRIELVHDYRHIGAGQGGWREDHQYYSQEAGI